MDFIIIIVSVLVGYFLRALSDKSPSIDIPLKQQLKVSKSDKSDLKPGVILRPTQTDILERTDSYHRKVKEGKDEMKKTLDEIIK